MADRLAALTVAIALLVAAGPAGAEVDRGDRLQTIRAEIARLEDELADLEARERTVLGELERLGTALRLREKQVQEVALQAEAIEAEIGKRDRTLAQLEQNQTRRSRYLSHRLREMYRSGPDHALRRFLGGDSVERYWVALRYAAFLSDTDARVLREFRAEADRIGAERLALDERRQQLADSMAELERARARAESGRKGKARALRALREDQDTRREAIVELETAAGALTNLVGSLAGEPGSTLDIRKFQGLLDWPSDGEVSAGFGTVIHPRFKTRVPHPGLDIEGELGSRIQSVFDGRVVFASWMRGYGLTAIVDHGGGLLSVYAHASALLVRPGEEVLRGALLGTVGDTGSLRGPYLYLELRIDGKPVDPTEWLRPR